MQGSVLGKFQEKTQVIEDCQELERNIISRACDEGQTPGEKASAFPR